jgi:heme exporter protein A
MVNRFAADYFEDALRPCRLDKISGGCQENCREDLNVPEIRLIADSIAKRFGRRYIFRDLSLTIVGGESVAVTGSNGSGKSTLLRILAGLMTPTRGTVKLQVQGRMVNEARRPILTGYVAPYLQLYDSFSARENLEFVAEARSIDDSASTIAGVLDRVGLSWAADQAISEYSSGMIQRARIASALLSSPRILMMDEPYSNLDEAGRGMVTTVLNEHLAAGGTVLLATNALEEAQLCERVVDVSEFSS